MDNVKYMKQNHKLQTTKSKTRTIGVNTEENYPKCNCHTTAEDCPRFILVPCLPFFYPMCTNTANSCCTPNFNINPNILNQYQFVHNGNDMKHLNKCEKHSAINLLHCCSSSNCTSCTNSSSGSGNNQKMVNTAEMNQKTPTASVTKNPRENGFRRSSQDKINFTVNEKYPTESYGNNSYFEATNENMKQYCDDEMTRYATELMDNQNYKMVAQEYEQSKIVNNDEKKIMNHLLTPTGRKFSNTITNVVVDESDECLEDSENEEETSSIDEDVPVVKAIQEEEERKRPSTADGRVRNNFCPLKNFSKPNGGKSSDLEMLMMLKAFVNQSAEKDVNPKLNQLINHLSSQETSIRPEGQIESKKSLIPRK